MEGLFERAVTVRLAPITSKPEGPVNNAANDEDPDHHVRRMAEHLHSPEEPKKKISDAIKDVCPGDH
jgi:hypothetical protein